MINAIMVDDEMHCIDTLSMLLADYCPDVHVLAKCNSAKKGIDAIELHKPDLVFLDIEMPQMNGFELLEHFKEIPFSVIFTTSYDQYAIKAIKYSALDYLLKPVDPKELIAAVHKMQAHKGPPSADQFRMLMEQIQNRESSFTKIAEILDKSNLLSGGSIALSKQRRLAAILFTDIVGYTALMQQDEKHAIMINKRHSDVLKQMVADHSGAVLNDYGDGNLCIFSSSTEAVECAMEVQQHLRNAPSVPLRIGLHIGEIFFEEGKVFGDGVNVASRIQSLAKANSILFSEEIQDKIRNNPKFKMVSLGTFEFKNVEKPHLVFALSNEGFSVPKPREMEGKLKKKKKRYEWFNFFSGSKDKN